MLHGVNADVLTLFSSTSPGLLISKSHLAIAIAYLDNVLKNSSSGSLENILLKDTLLGDDLKEQFTRLRSQLNDLDKLQENNDARAEWPNERDQVLDDSTQLLDRERANTSKTVVDIDPHKSFLLAHAFPKQFNEALALLTDKAIYLELWRHSDSPNTLVDQYMSGQNGDSSVFVRIKETADKEEIPPISSDPLKRINQLLKPLQYTLTRKGLERVECTEKKEKESKYSTLNSLLPTFNYVHVDPYTWYCSCSSYHEMQENEVFKNLGPEILRNTDNEYNVSKFLENSPCLHSDRLPMCKHLMAILLAASNFEVVKSENLITIVEIRREGNV